MPTERIYNFSAGPATMPLPVLEEAREALINVNGTGIGIAEHSHRSKTFQAICEEAEALARELASIPDDYDVFFVQGGASLQFAQVPMSFLSKGDTADYLVTGSWSKKAVKEAKLFGNVHTACSSEDRNFCYIPKECTYSAEPVYVHFTTNNTIFGTQFAAEPECPEGSFLVADASSDIFGRPLDVTKYGMIYAGAQKNLGPSGVTLMIARKDVVERGSSDLPAMLQYRTQAEAKSLYNTPPTFGIYVVMLVFRWLKEQGGLAAIEEKNKAKAGKLYDYLDSSSLFQPTADADSRSLMNVCFVTGDADKDAEFIKFATARGLDGLKGHRSVGGMRASIYNAFPAEGVDELIGAMREFEGK
ncbi:3-phosphoserine/phosphohydroxythreonine transaminase [Calycomorphotria hydatis]|uniref:Phosphoserine aminotransferase n=1 Tax=Calycomorphotria hydatis TaxID=2528027 RepID=A0A517T745_9PLAN|nr:3-phosphoserine/phosphohydroxythreonine transaminase [Calycomorphotria hydatis]QDT64192.1 Phosphoserine aminotransferase [Calycomorphotria hydatis]